MTEWGLEAPVSSRAGAETRPQRARIALYSHDSVSLGHIRRNLLIANALARSSLQASVLMIAGTREASTLSLPAHVDCLSLPGLSRDPGGRYGSRRLDLGLRKLLDLRAKTIRAALEEFDPAVLLVDSIPRGAGGELESSLEELREHGRTLCVLGLCDVPDHPVSSREWRRTPDVRAIQEHYDAVWVYGDPAVYDVVKECRPLLDAADRVRYTGYLDPQTLPAWDEVDDGELLENLGLPPGPFVLCLVGGGEDGARLAEAFVQADLPADTNGVILTGPFMSIESKRLLRQGATGYPRLRVLDFVTEPTQLLRHADRVVAKGGYNTVCDVMSFRKPALIVPRIEKGREQQLIRAERLRDLGLLDMLHPNKLTPGALTAWLAREAGPRPPVQERIDVNGLTRIPRLLAELLASSGLQGTVERNGKGAAAQAAR